MHLRSLAIVSLLLIASPLARASQADDTTINITAKTAGATPLISQLTLVASNPSVIDSIQFTIAAKPGSVTRLFSQTYSASYLSSRQYLQANGQIFLPVYGLYANFTNTVTLTYRFRDGSSKDDTTTITTTTINDPCGISTPTKLKARTASTSLSYDYMLVRGACGSGSGISPVILDTDGEVRWISPFVTDAILTAGSTFFDHAVYLTNGSTLYRVDLDGTVTSLADYASLGVVNFHHQIDPGRTGMILDADTTEYAEAVNMEVDGAGNLLQTWNMGDIFTKALVAGGDDPSEFVYPTPDDWFHNNSTAYRSSDDSLIVSAREDFVVALDYDDETIKWILGDTTKKWYQFSSLAQLSLGLGPNTLPPIGQHSVSLTRDNDLLLMDNGRNSLFLTPAGINRTYSAPRKYALNLDDRVATEVWNYTRDESIYSQFCGSIYEDAPLNYLIDYAFITAENTDTMAQLVGLDDSGTQVFDYQYPTGGCNTAYNSLPLHAEHFTLSTSGQALNLSTRGNVGTGENVLVGGFIVTGFEAKNIVVRALGPSLAGAGVTGALADPVLTIYDSTGAVVASNDEWANAEAASEIQARGLAPTDAHEAATLRRLDPGAYTVIVSGKSGSEGVGLVEAYDLTRNTNSELGNISTRGMVTPGDGALIGGFIIGNRSDATVVVRALGPSLAAAGIVGVLNNPTLTVYNASGEAVSSNDDWQNGAQAGMLQSIGLAPTDPSEAATLVTVPPGSYTAVVEGVDAGTGVGLLEVYNLP